MSTPTAPIAVWIQHGEARVFDFSPDLGRWMVRVLQAQDRGLFHQLLSRALSQGNPIVLIGPDLARFQFRNHLNEHHPSLARRIVACEAVGADTDAALASWGRHYLPKAVALG